MELSIKNTSVFLIALLAFTLSIAGFQTWKQVNKTAMQDATSQYATSKINVNESIQGIQHPQIQVENQHVRLNTTFDALSCVQVQDPQDGNISAHVEAFGEVDTTKAGEYVVRYAVRNSFGLKAVKTIKVLVD